jgi:amino acid efflux transporter
MNAQLQKHIGSKALLAYYISSVVGVGVLIIPGVAAQIAGPASLLAWVLLALISAPVAISFAKMAMLVPDSGGVPSFVEKRLDPNLGKALSLLLMVTMVFGNPVMGLATAYYLRDLLHFDAALMPWVSYSAMLLSIAFNLLGMRLGSRIQSFLLFLLIFGLAAVILLALPHGSRANLTPFFPPQGISAVGSALVICFFSFLGWENVSSIAEEVKEPHKAFRRAIPWAIVCVGGLYVLIAGVYLAVVPAGERAQDPTVLAPILRIVFGERVALAGGVVALLLLVLATNSWVLGASRLAYALSRNGLLPAAIGRVGGRTGVPAHALGFLAVGYGLVTLLIAGLGLSEQWLIRFANANFMLIYLCAFWAGLRIFESARMRLCAWVAIVATACFVPFFGGMALVSAALTGTALLWLRRRGHKAQAATLAPPLAE